VCSSDLAANQKIRSNLESLCTDEKWEFVAPPPALCSDNALMIAWAGLERAERGETSPMNIAPRSRWPLDETSKSIIGSGRKGAKA